MNKIKRGNKIEKRDYIGYTWICVECGREWLYQNYARRCEHRNTLMFYSHDEIAECLNKI